MVLLSGSLMAFRSERLSTCLQKRQKLIKNKVAAVTLHTFLWISFFVFLREKFQKKVFLG